MGSITFDEHPEWVFAVSHFRRWKFHFITDCVRNSIGAIAYLWPCTSYLRMYNLTKTNLMSSSCVVIPKASILERRVTHICVTKLTSIGSDNGLSPGRRQAIIWTSDGILLIGSLRTNFNEIIIKIYTFSYKKMHLKMSSRKWRSFCLGLNVLTAVMDNTHFDKTSS